MHWPTQPISPNTAGGFSSAMISFFSPELRNVCTCPVSIKNSRSPRSPERKKICPAGKSVTLLSFSKARKPGAGTPLNRSLAERAAASSRLALLLVFFLRTVIIYRRFGSNWARLAQLSRTRQRKPHYTFSLRLRGPASIKMLASRSTHQTGEHHVEITSIANRNRSRQVQAAFGSRASQTQNHSQHDARHGELARRPGSVSLFQRRAGFGNAGSKIGRTDSA